MTRSEKLQAAAFILLLFAAVIADASMLAAAILISTGGLLTVLSYKTERARLATNKDERL